MEELEKSGLETDGGTLLGLPETENELDNLTEYNTAQNRSNIYGYMYTFHIFLSSVSDPFHFDADPDPDLDPRIRFRDNGSASKWIRHWRKKCEKDTYTYTYPDPNRFQFSSLSFCIRFNTHNGVIFFL